MRYWLYQKQDTRGAYGFVHEACEEQMNMSPRGWSCRDTIVLTNHVEPVECLYCDLHVELECHMCDWAKDNPESAWADFDGPGCLGYSDCIVDPYHSYTCGTCGKWDEHNTSFCKHCNKVHCPDHDCGVYE